eukprot:767895-Hanusia_phi.AAC.6
MDAATARLADSWKSSAGRNNHRMSLKASVLTGLCTFHRNGAEGCRVIRAGVQGDVFRWDPNDHQRGVHLKIADYGLPVMASRGYAGAQGATVSTAGSTARPIRCMALEGIARRQYTDKSDVWAFGVTMWYGQVPYGAITDDEMVGQRVGERTPVAGAFRLSAKGTRSHAGVLERKEE